MFVCDGMCYNRDTMKVDAVLNMRVPGSVKDALARAADDNLRTMSSMATWALVEWLGEHGYLDHPATAARRPTASRPRKK